MNSALVDCVGVAPMKCMRVAPLPQQPWELFYTGIEGSPSNRAISIG
ncbi:DUF4377 domain-containing protein [Serratia ureilytica]